MRRETLTALRRELAAKRAVVLATDLDSGDERLLRPDQDGDGAPALLAAAREAIRLDRSGMAEGVGRWFLRVYNPPVRVVVVGAVHVTQALGPICLLTGFDVLVVDPRRAFATSDRFRGLVVSTEWPDEALARLGADRRTAVITMTHDPKIDDPALAAALRSPAFYVGALGSKKTQAARRDRLLARGLTDLDLARIRGPVGLRLGAVTPGEIAISILAQLVAALRLPDDAA